MPGLSQQQGALLPQAYLTNFHNRVKDDGVALMTASAQPTRGHKRAKVVNYAEFDNDIFDDFAMNDAYEYDDDENNGATSNAADSKGYGEDMNNEDASNSNNNNTTTTTTATTAAATTTNNNNESENGDNPNSNNISKKDLKNKLPDLEDQDELLNILKYPRIRETFQQSKIALPYRLNLFKNNQLKRSLAIKEDEKQQIQEPIIIPISFNIEHGGHAITDTITWNLNDHSITPEEFATIYCRDLDFTSSSNASTNLHNQIVTVIMDAITEYESLASLKINSDLQIIINLTCHLQNTFYEDNFQWNLNDESLTPELFAEIVVTDLGLTREFMPLISYTLHETLLKIKKEYLEGHLNQDSVQNEAAFGYMAGVRLDLEDLGGEWCPRVEVLTLEEIQRREIEKERKLRRLKRESDRLNRRGRRRLDDLETTMKI